MRLTEAKIRSLTSQDREYREYFHEPTPSAGIRVYRGGRKVFFLYYRSPTLVTKGRPGERLLRRVWFGCHESGKPAWKKGRRGYGRRPASPAFPYGNSNSSIGGSIWRIRYKVERDHLVPLVGPIAEILHQRNQEVGSKGPLFWPDVDPTRECERFG